MRERERERERTACRRLLLVSCTRDNNPSAHTCDACVYTGHSRICPINQFPRPYYYVSSQSQVSVCMYVRSRSPATWWILNGCIASHAHAWVNRSTHACMSLSCTPKRWSYQLPNKMHAKLYPVVLKKKKEEKLYPVFLWSCLHASSCTCSLINWFLCACIYSWNGNLHVLLLSSCNASQLYG